jgi:hypothetical protein
MKYFLIKGAIIDGDHEYSKSMVCKRKGMTSRWAKHVFLDNFNTGDYRIALVDYFQEITRQEYEVLKKYL